MSEQGDSHLGLKMERLPPNPPRTGQCPLPGWEPAGASAFHVLQETPSGPHNCLPTVKWTDAHSLLFSMLSESTPTVARSALMLEGKMLELAGLRKDNILHNQVTHSWWKNSCERWLVRHVCQFPWCKFSQQQGFQVWLWMPGRHSRLSPWCTPWALLRPAGGSSKGQEEAS